MLLRGCLAWQVRIDGPNSLDRQLWQFLQTWQAAASTFPTWYLLIDSLVSTKESISFCVIMTVQMLDFLGIFSDHFGFDIGKFACQSNFLGYPT